MEPLRLRLAESEDFSEKVIAELKENFDLVVAPCEQDGLVEIFETFDVFWFRLGFNITADLFSEKTRCRIIATPVTGIDHIDEKACADHGIKIICLRGETEFLKEVRATAEMTIALTLALLRQLYPAIQDVLAGNWRRDIFRGREIYKKTVGIVGLGRLGRIVAEYFKTMGAEILAYDIHSDFPDFVTPVNSLEALFDQSDIVSIHVNYNEKTHHLINRQILRFCDDNMIIINTSRGGIIEETALLTALESGKLGGAALDVLQEEKNFDGSNPLVQYALNHDNLIIVPHIGGNTYESFEKTEMFILKKILKAI